MGKRVHDADEPRKLEFKFDVDHFIDVITFDESIAVSELFSLVFDLQQASKDESKFNAIAVMARIPAQLKQIKAMLSKLVWHGDHYLEQDEAAPIVGLMTIAQIWQAVSGLMELFNSEANGNAEASEPVNQAG